MPELLNWLKQIEFFHHWNKQSTSCPSSQCLTRQIIPRLIKSTSKSIWYNYQRICSYTREPETTLEIRKKVTFLKVINKPIINKFFDDSADHIKMTNKMAVFSHWYPPNILQGLKGKPSNKAQKYIEKFRNTITVSSLCQIKGYLHYKRIFYHRVAVDA